MNVKSLSLTKAAKMYAVSRWTLWYYVRSGKLKAFRTPDGHYRISEPDLEAFMSRKKVDPRGKGPRFPKKILVVDDDPAIREYFLQILSHNGFKVKEASDGFEAGQLVEKFRPEILILDIIMPKMDGFEVCRRIKQDPETEHIKIIAISGFDTYENRNKIMDCGADLFLSKPLDIKKLLEDIENMYESGESV